MTRRSSSRSSRRSSKRSSPRSSRGKSQPTLWQRLSKDQKLDILGWVLVIIAALTILSMLSAEQGVLTRWWISVLKQLFGWGRYVVPVFLGAVGLWLVLRHFGDRIPTPDPEQVVGVILGFFVISATMHFFVARVANPTINPYDLGQSGLGGGLLGALLLDTGIKWLGPAGMVFALVIGWIITLTFAFSISPAEALQWVLQIRDRKKQRQEAGKDISQKRIPDDVLDDPVGGTAEPIILGGQEKGEEPDAAREEKPAPVINAPARTRNGNGEVNIPPLEVGAQAWRLPTVADVLVQSNVQDYSDEIILEQAKIIENTLEVLGAPADVVETNPGPVVTQFGAKPRSKVRVSKIANLADDLALALAAKSIRIEAPIPGRGLIGIEVPNEEPAVVSLRDVMESDSFGKLKGRLRLGLGESVSGQAVAADLRAMPHLLIAGATGAGKSVCINSIITALLLQNSPDTLRLILIDPKRVELTQYNGIPHLLAPVISDVDRVVPTLRWVMREMDSRYRRFADIGARHIEDYNRRVRKSGEADPIPYVGVLIDELADLMMQAPDETERAICRLAQMARATGIHLIIATQRPSVDVVTGLIKANFPARIAFAVASSVDSRVILDSPGAERLLGRGDMLFMPPDVAQPLRLQGAFVSDQEIEHLIRYWRNAVEPGEVRELGTLSKGGLSVEEVATQPPLFPTFEEPTSSEFEFEDELLPAAVEVFLGENRASTSLLQRRLRIGYTRAARLMEILSEMGIVADEMKGQSRKVNRAVAEELLRSVNSGEPATSDAPPF